MLTSTERAALLAKLKCNPVADASLIQKVEADCGFRLPDEYAQFMQQANGGEGFVGNTYLILWRVEELPEMNKAYQVAEYAPGLFLFGSDGGGEAFAFDTRSNAKAIVSVPFVGMELSLARHLAPDFNGFLTKLFNS